MSRKIDIGSNIRFLIDTTPNVTIKKLSDHLKMAPSNLSRKLNTTNWDAETIFEVATFFKMTVDDLFKKRSANYIQDHPVSKFEEVSPKYKSSNSNISVRIKIEIEIDPTQIGSVEDIRNRIIHALK